ncbi:polyphosphate polymerase domain-containing protein [Papillibacter cinnamivorans]|uniref:VTC domain-containing protein n=1 Tax=Papillibacter cinnamivorans DSM 12816 TaxID=1122930 RepID=A0A1W2BB04_9FIRM|nr:polyphosphate polymerase domain-containing protein [Papillibacter cinnamivorans]SMC70024.1 VTC domain-containing protein [Papillibacter cinnamivorans DSM 12816]
MAITAFKRNELKFILDSRQYSALLPRLEEYMERDVNCRSGNDYGIYNIYYDTPDDRLIRTSLSKPKYKEKLRMRSYCSPASPEDTVFLELKKKTAGVVHKRRAVLSLREAEDFLRWRLRPESESYMNRQVLNELEYFLNRNEVSPAAYISYRRVALFGLDDPSFRVTFDRDILARRTELGLDRESFGLPILAPGLYLMEIKVSGSVPLWLADALAELGIYKASFSKYGMEYKLHSIAASGGDDRRFRTAALRAVSMPPARREREAEKNACSAHGAA